MAVASWMIRTRNIRSGRFCKSKQENEDDIVKLDLKRDPHLNAKEIFTELSKSDLSDGRRLNYLNSFVKLTLHLSGNFTPLGYTIEEVLYCLRFSLVNNSTQIRSGAFRAIRHVLMADNDVIAFNKLLIPYMAVRSLDVCLKSNDIERIEVMKLIRKVLLISPIYFDMGLARSLISLANSGIALKNGWTPLKNGGIALKDRMLRVCLAALSELGILNPDLFIAVGGVAAITGNLLECQTPKIAESLCGVLLLLLDRPITRNHAAVDLHCVAAPYCDFHYRHGWMDKNRDERELRFNCSRLALLSILRSWPGIMHFCSPNDTSSLKAIVDVLYLNQLDVRKAVLDLLYELLNLPQPEWTDEFSVALSAIDPAEPQASWRLGEGFVAAEGRSVLPHLARTTPSISDMHLSLLLYCFLETGLLDALAEVIATSDTFISVRATVLLGELLRLVQILLPPECCNISPALPNLLEYATMSSPQDSSQALGETKKRRPQALRAITALQQLHKLLKRRPASYSLYLDYILQSGTCIKVSNKSEKLKPYKMSHSKSKLSQLVMKDSDVEIKETGVLLNKDANTWNWNLIKVILKGECDLTMDLSEANHRLFLKRLVEYYIPSNNQYSHMDLITPKNAQGYTLVGIELILFLLRREDTLCYKFLLELFNDISLQIEAILHGKSAHDCLFSPQHMANTQCQSYFLFIGRLASKTSGIELLNTVKIFKLLQQLATTTNHDCYVKLIVSSLDYKENSTSRELLTSILSCPVESSRLYATQFLLVLLRAGLPQFHTWGMKLLASQLHDKSRTVYLSALATIHEACELPNCLEQLVKLNPDLLHLGEKGNLLLIRFMSIPTGYIMLNKKDFITNELRRWDEYFNFRYVVLVEGETADALTLHQRGEDGRYDKRTSLLRSSSRKDLFLPPHIYGQLSKHCDGFQLLLEHSEIEKLIQFVYNGHCETDDDILKMKGAIWALGHFGSSPKGSEFLMDKNVLPLMVGLAENCVVYSIRATAFYSLGLIATTKYGADSLFKLGWVCTRHDRHDRWPIIEEENWEDKDNMNVPISSESDRSDQAFASDICMLDVDSSTTTEEEIIVFPLDTSYMSNQGKSLTLPNQNILSGQHKRSLSESKTFEMLRGSDRKERFESRLSTEIPHRYRDNSVTESTTSGVSSCESVLGKSIITDRFQVLTPIPSISSIKTMNMRSLGNKLRRHSESSKRGSNMGQSDRLTISPAGSSIGKLSHQDLIGYETVRMIRLKQKQVEAFDADGWDVHSLDRRGRYHSLTETESSHFLLEGLSFTSLSSFKRFGIKDTRKTKGQIYMGIALPITLTHLFPNYQVTARRLSYTMDKILLSSSDSDSDDSSLSTSTPTSLKKVSRFAKHSTKTCLSCSNIRGKLRKRRKESLLAGDSRNEEAKEALLLKLNILSQVEQLSNPALIKAVLPMLLDLKQRHAATFQDLCLYSEVCKIVSENAFQLDARRFLHDIFCDVNFDSFALNLNAIVSTERNVSVSNLQDAQVKKVKYTDIAKEQRKQELIGGNKMNNSKNVVIGFVVEKIDEPERFSPTRFEPRSPPLSSVKEENVASSENLWHEKTSIPKQNSNTHKTDNKPLIKTLDQLKLTYNENKFPIKTRDVKKVIE